MEDVEAAATVALSSLDILHIKTPQLLGIIAGCLVFTVTIAVVLYLLYASGTWAGFLEEVKSGKPVDFKSLTSAIGSSNSKQLPSVPQLSDLPKLYEELIEASKKLPLRPVIPNKGCLIHPGPEKPTVCVKEISEKSSSSILKELYVASDGSAVFGECAYNPLRIWGWLLIENNAIVRKWDSESAFVEYFSRPLGNGVHLAIVDMELDKAIGMVSLVENSPSNLTIQVDNIWLTPAFQGKKRGQESIMLILQWLFASGYRRIYCEVDVRNQVARKFLERCSFLMEAILRKHKVVEDCNRDTALYVLLNSDWIGDHELKMKRYLGWTTKPVVDKAFDIKPFQFAGSSHRNSSNIVDNVDNVDSKMNVSNGSKSKKSRNKGKAKAKGKGKGK